MTSWINNENSGLRAVPVGVDLAQERLSTSALWGSTDGTFTHMDF